MKNNKQTAVEWLLDEIKKMKIGNNQLLIYYEDLDYLIEKAKQMEKQQMKDVLFEKTLRPFKFDFEQYYNEEYNK